MDSRSLTLFTVMIIGTVLATINLAHMHAEIMNDATEIRQHLSTRAPPVKAGGLVAALPVTMSAVAIFNAPGPESVPDTDRKTGQVHVLGSRQLADQSLQVGAGQPRTGILADQVLEGAATTTADSLVASKAANAASGAMAAASNRRKAGVSALLKAVNSQAMLSERACGSPAVEGYSLVKPACLYESPAARWWKLWGEGGGNPADLVVHIQHNTDLDGLAVSWGIDHKVESVEACGEACRNHVPNPTGGGFEPLPCNTFTFCPDAVCWEPDIHKHTQGDCWLKFAEGPASPEVNMRGQLSEAARQRHPRAPATVQWHSGVLLPPGVKLVNGTWSPRYDW